MIVVGPTGNRVRLPAAPGRTYPGYGIVVQRSQFDATLRLAAVSAGAEFFEGRADDPIGDEGRLSGFSLSSTTRVRADVIVGADGATSRVAETAHLVDPGRLLWGFAVRTYLDEAVDDPHIMLWTPVPGTAFPGYGWVFPAGAGQVNVGLGVGVLADRTAGRRAAHDLDAFLEHASHVGVLGARTPPIAGSTSRCMAQDGTRGYDAGTGSRPPGRRRLRLGESAARRRDRASNGQRPGRRRSDPSRHRSSVRSVPRARGLHVRAVPVDDGARPPITSAQAEARGHAHPRADLTRRRPLTGRWLVDHVERPPRRRAAQHRDWRRDGRGRSRAHADRSKPRTDIGSERTSRASRNRKGWAIGRRRERARRASRPPEERRDHRHRPRSRDRSVQLFGERHCRGADRVGSARAHRDRTSRAGAERFADRRSTVRLR